MATFVPFQVPRKTELVGPPTGAASSASISEVGTILDVLGTAISTSASPLIVR